MKPSTTVMTLSNRLSYVVALILAVLPFHALLTTWGGSNSGHIEAWVIWKELLIFFILLPSSIWLIWRSEPLKQWLIRSWVLKLLAIYIFLHLTLGVLAYTDNTVDEDALIHSLIINLRFFVFFIICAVVAAHSDFLKKNWLRLLLIPASVVLLFALLQKFLLPTDFLKHFGYGPNTIPTFQAVDNNPEFPRLQATLRGPNPLGAYLVLIIPTIIIGFSRKILKGIVLASAAVVLFYSYSRSAWIGALISSLLLIGWAVRNRYKFNWLLFGTSVAVLLIAGGIYLFKSNESIQTIFLHTSDSSTSELSSNEMRAQSLKNSTEDVIEEPLGGGPGTAGPASFRNHQPPRIAENYYLQIGQEVGVLGAIIFLVINIVVAAQLWQRRNYQLARVLLVSFIGLSFVNLLSHAWTDDTLAYIWWGLAGVALAPAILKKSQKTRQND